MSNESAAVAVKVAATGAVAAFGLTWWAVAGAVLGAVASLHFEPPAAGSKVWRVVFQVFAMATLAALLGSALPIIPGFGALEAIPVAVRCGLLGIFGSLANNWIRAFIARKTAGG
jgi:hypothetical protein